MDDLSTEIKYSFNHLEIALIAFITNMELKLKEVLPKMPVFVLETGDTTYYLEDKFLKTSNEEIYQKVPRFIIGIEDIQPQFDQNTNQYNKVIYKFEDVNYVAECRRLSLLIPIETSFVSPNFIMALRNFEILSMMMIRENPFTYDFLGNTYSGAYSFQTPSLQKPGLDVSSSTKNPIIKSLIELWLNILVPRLETIKPLSEVGFDSINFDITVKGADEDFLDNLNSSDE